MGIWDVGGEKVKSGKKSETQWDVWGGGGVKKRGFGNMYPPFHIKVGCICLFTFPSSVKWKRTRWKGKTWCSECVTIWKSETKLWFYGISIIFRIVTEYK